MSVRVRKGTKIRLQFDDKTTLDYEPTEDLELDYVLGQIEHFARIFEPERTDVDR